MMPFLQGKKPMPKKIITEPHWSTMWLPKIVDIMTAIRDHTTRNAMSEFWTPQTHTLPIGTSKNIIKRNPQRRRAVIWTDSANTSAVWISPSPINGDDAPVPGGGAVPLAPDSLPFEMFHCGEVHAWSSTSGNVCVVEEYGAND